MKETTVAVDVDFFVESLPVVAGNVVTTVNNARHQGLENTPPGDVYDVGQYYDSMTSDCKTKITRSKFREDFIDRVVPMIAKQQPERVTATVEGTRGIARVEQVSGTTVVMKFDLAGTVEKHACNDAGTIDITVE